MDNVVQVFWVTGSSSDVGKTTIACALTRLLNQLSIPAAGFKPYALTHLQQNIDFLIEHCPPQSERLFGGDASKLATSSTLTAESKEELVAPCNAFAFPEWKYKLLLRVGSKHTGRTAYFTTQAAKELLERSDLKRLQSKVFLPLEQAEVISVEAMRNSPILFPEEKSLAFNKLVDSGAKAIVCEGGGQIAPIWQSCPMVNHLVHIAGGVIYFYKSLNANFSTDKLKASVHVSAILNYARTKSILPLAREFPMVEQPLRNKMAEHILKNLLVSSGYVNPEYLSEFKAPLIIPPDLAH